MNKETDKQSFVAEHNEGKELCVEAWFCEIMERERNSWKTNYYMMRQDIAEIREIIAKDGTADDVLKFLDTPKL